MTTAVVLGVGLVVYGTALNLAPLRDRLYLTLNIGAGGIVAVTALEAAELDAAALGLGRPSGVTVALSVVLVGLAVVGVAAVRAWARRSGRVAALLDDRRVAGLDTAEVVERATLRIPVGTAAFEELAFRGALLAVLMQVVSTPAAIVGSSLAFGLWHVAPTWQYLRMNDVRQRLGPIALAVVGTGLGGAALCGLRLATGGLLVPWVAHGALNVGALVATHLQHRDQRA